MEYKPARIIEQPSPSTTFAKLCFAGDITAAQTLLDEDIRLDVHANGEEAFRLACSRGHSDMVKWLLSLESKYGAFRLHLCGEESFRLACGSGNPRLIAILLSLVPTHGAFDTEVIQDRAFVPASKGDSLQFVKDILNFEPIHTGMQLREDIEACFTKACCVGRRESAEFLLTHVETREILFPYMKNEHLFHAVCEAKQLAMAKWLFPIDAYGNFSNTRAWLESALFRACFSGNLELAKWISEVCEGAMERKLPVADHLLFLPVCLMGYLEIAKWLVEEQPFGEVNIHVKNDAAFRKACLSGNVEIVKWLLSLEQKYGKIDINREGDVFSDERSFFACLCGKTDVATAQWFLSLEATHGPIDIHAGGEDAFCTACGHGNLVVAKWLYSLAPMRGEINIHADEERAFRNASEAGKLEVARWLLSLGKPACRINIHANGEEAFRGACISGALETAQWLWSLAPTHGEIDLKAAFEDALINACENEHLNTAGWLLGLKAGRNDRAILTRVSNCLVETGKYQAVALLTRVNPEIFDDIDCDANDLALPLLRESKYMPTKSAYQLLKTLSRKVTLGPEKELILESVTRLTQRMLLESKQPKN